jgi:hypothetical protein
VNMKKYHLVLCQTWSTSCRYKHCFRYYNTLTTIFSLFRVHQIKEACMIKPLLPLFFKFF